MERPYDGNIAFLKEIKKYLNLDIKSMDIMKMNDIGADLKDPSYKILCDFSGTESRLTHKEIAHDMAIEIALVPDSDTGLSLREFASSYRKIRLISLIRGYIIKVAHYPSDTRTFGDRIYL